jgi:hypothetical protein
MAGVSKWVLGAHAVVGSWLLLSGAGHQLQVLYKAWRGTLGRPDLSGLLAVGAGLLAAGAAVTWSLAPLSQSARVTPALLSLVALFGVLGLVYVGYGARFLGGSLTLGLIDAIGLLSFALLAKRS